MSENHNQDLFPHLRAAAEDREALAAAREAVGRPWHARALARAELRLLAKLGEFRYDALGDFLRRLEGRD